MNANPLVSVITPSYNSESFIKQTIESVQSQTYQNWEMIIVDDCSTDKTIEIIEQIAKDDTRIHLIKLTENSGAAVARNTAIRNAKGKYIAFLDSDDSWLPNKLEKQVYFMLENDYAFSYTSYRIMNEDGTKTGKVIEVPGSVTYEELLKGCIIGCLTVMIDIEKLGKVQMPEIRTRQDFALWLSILRKGITAYGLQEELSLYRKVTSSISSNKVKAAKQNWKVYREIEKLGLLKSIWVFLHYAYNGVRKNM